LRGDILLCDLDAFYASVEQLDHPELKGKPVIVGGLHGNRGVVAACSYEARAFGVRSAMPTVVAKKLCPQAIIRPVNMKRYQELSAKVLNIYESFTPLIEVVSIDEAYLEVGKGRGVITGTEIRKAVQKELSLAVSIGVSSNKLLAKISSNLAKPNGLKALWPKDAPQVLGGYSVRIIPGVGPKTADFLKSFGIDNISELSKYPIGWFRNHLGARGIELFNYVNWVDERPLELNREQKSIGREITFTEDISDKEKLLAILNELSQEVGYRLRKTGFKAKTLSIKIRFPDFTTITRSKTPGYLLYTDGDLFKIAKTLFEELKLVKPLRLIGVTVSNLDKELQLSLFTEEEKNEDKLAEVIDRINEKFGNGTIKRCGGKG